MPEAQSPRSMNFEPGFSHETLRGYSYNDSLLTPDEALAFTRDAMNWLPHKLHAHQNEFSMSRKNTILENGDETHDYVQFWGGIDEATVKQAGVSVEVGGPSAYDPNDILIGFRADFISNITTDVMPKGGQQAVVGSVDLVANARNMPFADASVGSIRARALPGILSSASNKQLYQLREAAITEACRVIKPGGFWFGTVAQ